MRSTTDTPVLRSRRTLKLLASSVLFNVSPRMTFNQIRKQVTEHVPFAQLTGVEIGEVVRGRASARLADRPELQNHVGSLHAAALYTLGETASGLAMASTLAPIILGVSPVAAGASIRYLKIARGSIAAAASYDGDPDALVESLRLSGRVQFELDVEMRDQAGILVATMTVEWHARLKK